MSLPQLALYLPSDRLRPRLGVLVMAFTLNLQIRLRQLGRPESHTALDGPDELFDMNTFLQLITKYCIHYFESVR